MLWKDEGDLKRKNLLQAGLNEFAAKGYEQASTNAIVQQAGVSKGLLFHHFRSKKQLYLYIAEQCMAYFFNYLQEHHPLLSREPLERIRDINRLKLRLFAEQPAVYRLSVRFFTEYPQELEQEVHAFEERFFQLYFQFYHQQVDLAVIRKSRLNGHLLRLIFESIELLTRKYVEKTKRAEDQGLSALKELSLMIDEYIHLLKFGVYDHASGA